MIGAPRSLVAALLALGGLCLSATADEAKDSPAGEKFTLRYQFHPGETLRWEVVHRAKIRTTVSGTTQTAETVSSSVKVWRVSEVDETGKATFEHLVDSVDMSQKLTGRAEVRYNSLADKEPPAGFERQVQRPDRAGLERGEGAGRQQVLGRQQLAGRLRFGHALFGEVDIPPAGEAVF